MMSVIAITRLRFRERRPKRPVGPEKSAVRQMRTARQLAKSRIVPPRMPNEFTPKFDRNHIELYASYKRVAK